jgi:predicted nuclease of predicted toxin-antitoxin system
MKFKLDENLPGEGVLIRPAAGHDAVTVLDQGLGGRPDPEIFKVAQAEGRCKAG